MPDVSKEVIEQAASGDVAAFETLYRAYGDHVYNVSLRVLRNREDAQEVVQEVFVTLHAKLKGFRADAALKTWLYRVTVNTAINYYKKRQREQGRQIEYDDERHDAGIPAVREAAEKEYKEGLIQKLLAMLSPEQKVCVILRSLEGLTYEQIAAALGVNINVVRSRLKRAREKMLSAKREVMADGL